MVLTFPALERQATQRLMRHYCVRTKPSAKPAAPVDMRNGNTASISDAVPDAASGEPIADVAGGIARELEDRGVVW